MKANTRKSPTGKWRIVEMEVWDQEYVDMEGPGYISFKKDGDGQFHFGCVEAQLDWRQEEGSDRVDFTFMGFDEGDEVTGRGWVKVKGKELEGQIVFHQGDESAFKAKKGTVG